MTDKDADYQPIADYGIIGDCHTAALISKSGSIDWYCPARFDAPAIFCRLLDAAKGGFFSLSPVNVFSVERRYSGDTNILETVFTAGEARLRITDFMPVHQRMDSSHGYDVGTSRRILRLAEGLNGEAEVEVCFRPTFDYARGETRLEVNSIGAIGHRDGHYLSLASPEPGLELQAGGQDQFCGRFRLRAGDRRWLVLTEADDPDRVLELPAPAQCEQQLLRTRQYWENWVARCTYRGSYRDMVLRSALTLKLLTYEPTGAIIAAPTTSLPEEIGGVRNWDYRFAWVRDSALILYALLTIGYREEAADFFEWLQETHHNDASPDLHVLYGVDGRRDLVENTLDHLEGYRGSRPVRFGNAAAKQLQLDIYGEALTAAYLYFNSGIGKRKDNDADLSRRERILKHDWPLLNGLVARAAQRWREPDNGIWEVRGGLQSFLYSRLMCWAALDRGIRLAREFSMPAPLDKWVDTKKAIGQALLNEGFNKEMGAFTQAFGNAALDASALLIPRVGLLPATDPRFKSTIKAMKSRLTKDGLVYRYLSRDGLPGNEGMFLTCTFWLVDALALSGQIDEAHAHYERVTGYANDLGLFSEEVDVKGGNFLGNFPQGFTHMALINAAVNLAKVAKHGAEEHTETEADRARKATSAAAEGYPRLSKGNIIVDSQVK
jgi:GH15 family glucan-1,4-alpha-glucosidase